MEDKELLNGLIADIMLNMEKMDPESLQVFLKSALGMSMCCIKDSPAHGVLLVNRGGVLFASGLNASFEEVGHIVMVAAQRFVVADTDESTQKETRH